MRKTKSLTKRQLDVIEDLLAEDMDERAVLDKHNVKPALYNRWLTDERFVAALELRVARAYRAGQVILARYATLAASKLVALTECQQGETARKACLDIINVPSTAPAKPAGDAKAALEKPKELNLAPETVSRLLAVLAEDEPK